MQVGNQFYTTVSKKGQVTIPAEIRRRYNLSARKQVVFEMEKDVVVIRPIRLSLAEVFGAVKPIGQGFAKMREIVREERVKKAR